MTRQTLARGVSSIFGFIPTDVVFARIIPSSGWKFSNSARVIACPPTLLASFWALSSSQKKQKLFTIQACRNKHYSWRNSKTPLKVQLRYHCTMIFFFFFSILLKVIKYILITKSKILTI
jgi:hypothetical protein